MALSGIISVSGISGLHKVLSQTKNGLIVESLIDGKRRPIYSTQKVSTLEDISVYTTEDDVPLADVFKLIYEKEGGKKAPDHKSKIEDLRKYLSSVLKNIDHEKVYNSDVAKMFQWYNSLIEKKMLKFEDEKKKETKGDKKAPAKKEGAKKTAAVKKKEAPKKAVKINSPKVGPNKAGGAKKTASSKKA